MRPVQQISIFLASPGDVEAERQFAREVVEEIDRTIAKSRDLTLHVTGWDTHTYPSYGADGQAIINSQIGTMEEYDLFVGIMWNRFGTPTPRAESGTEEEFRRAVRALDENGQPHIMLYFSQQAANLNSQQAIEQKSKVLEFRQQVHARGLARDYSDPAGFEKLFRQNLTQWLTALSVSTPSPPALPADDRSPTSAVEQNSSADTPSTPPVRIERSALNAPSLMRAKETEPEQLYNNRVTDSGMWLLLNDSFYKPQSLKDRADGTIVVQVVTASAEDNRNLRVLRAENYGRQSFIPYAHKNEAGYVQIVSADMESAQPHSDANAHAAFNNSNYGLEEPSDYAVWTLTLKLEPNSGSYTNEFSFNNVSADEIARLRARLILLNEKPTVSQGVDAYLLAVVMDGRQGRLRSSGGIFPELWQRFQVQPAIFLPLARLWAVFHLKSSYLCEHVLELALGPIQNGTLDVTFRGQRHRRFDNEDPRIVEVIGKCDLNPRV
jgi:hypothetical protein